MSDQTWTSLAEATGFSARSFRDWRKMPGAPKEPDREKWLAFIEEHELGIVGNKVSKDREHWLTQQAEYRAKLLAIQHDQAQRKLLSGEEVARLHLFVATRAKSKLYQALETEAPPKLDGLSAAEQRPILRGIADSIADEMADLFAEFNKQ